MKRAFIISAAIGVLLSTTSNDSSAQPFDHLKCYRAKDSVKFDGVLNLIPEQQPPFSLESGCKVKIKAKEFCVAVQKEVVDTDAPGPGAPYPTDGIPLERDYICYKVKCPKSEVPDTEVADQFATRTLSKFKAKKICVPAVKTCAGSEAPECNGVCPFNDPCVDFGGFCGCF